VPAPEGMSRDELITLVAAQAEQIAELVKANESLAAKLAKVEHLPSLAVFLMVAHFVPAHRCVALLEALTGAAPSVGFVHGMLARAAGLPVASCATDPSLADRVGHRCRLHRMRMIGIDVSG
jgi:hypothetical protein